MIWLLHWLAVHTGTINEGGPYYGFWSGFGSDIGEVAIIGCWRLGRHQTGAGHHVCRGHHPDDPLTRQDVLDAHAAAKPRQPFRAAKTKAP